MKATLIHYAKIIGSSIVLLLVVVTVLFVLLELTPGDPVQSLVGDFPVSGAFRAEITATFGLDRPIWERYFIYLGNVFSGNLGYSFVSGAPVADLIQARIGNTLALAIPAFFVSTVGGIILGSIAARTRKRWLDGAISGSAVALFSIPNFWLGLMLVMLFSVTLGWLPAQGMSGYGSSGISITYMILPIFTLASTELAYKTRIMRSSMIESLGQDFIDTARSKGLSAMRVLWRHGFPNALLPMVTVSGYSLGLLLAGSVLVEKVFSWPGMGLLLVDAIENNDNMLVLGVVIILTISILIVNIITDIVYGLVDPRLRARIAQPVRTMN